jgi:hypothetical protein
MITLQLGELDPETTAVPNPQLNTNSLSPSAREDQQAVFVQNQR